MNKLIYFCLFLLVGCVDPYVIDDGPKPLSQDRMIIRTHEGCEYIEFYYGDGLTHKGNCSNPIHCYNESK